LWSSIGGFAMADLKREYTDIKNVKHNVEHIVLSNDKNSKEQMIEEIFYVLAKTNKHIA